MTWAHSIFSRLFKKTSTVACQHAGEGKTSPAVLSNGPARAAFWILFHLLRCWRLDHCGCVSRCLVLLLLFFSPSLFRRCVVNLSDKFFSSFLPSQTKKYSWQNHIDGFYCLSSIVDVSDCFFRGGTHETLGQLFCPPFPIRHPPAARVATGPRPRPPPRSPTRSP